jgi:hypothetical protein
MVVVDNAQRGKVNLTEISNELYKRQQRREGRHGKIEKNKLSNFMSKNSRYLSEIINTLQLSEYFKYIKPGFDINENGYEFSVKSKEFLIELLDKFTEPNVLEMRRGHWDKVSDRYIIWIVEGMYRVFMNNKIPKEDLAQIGKIMSNLTDYPVRERYGKVLGMTFELERLAGRTYRPKWLTNLGGNENCVWLDAMAEDLKRFLDKWGFIYDNMGEIRQMEINDIAEKCAADLTADQELRAELEFAFAEQINEALSSDEKLQKKTEEMRKEIYDKKTGSYIKKQEDYEYLRKIVAKRRTEVEQEVWEKCCPGIEVPLEDDIVNEKDFANMKSAEEILLESIEDYKESLVPFPKVDLPDIDIDAVIEQFRVEHGLQGDIGGVKRK